MTEKQPATMTHNLLAFAPCIMLLELGCTVQFEQLRCH